MAAGADMAREMAEQPAVIQQLVDRREELSAALRALVRERPAGVLLVARGSSDNAAVYGRYVLEAALRRPVTLAAPSLWTRYGLREDLRGHLAVGVSQSGRTPEITSTMALIRDAGAATVAITNDPGSPLATTSDLTVELGVGEEVAVPATKTVSAQLAAMAMIAQALGDPLWPSSAWNELPGAMSELLGDDRPAAAAGAAIAASARHVQLARGFLFAVALEGALKVAETTSIASTGFSVADFRHGPIAVAGPGTSVVAYAAPGPVADDVRETALAARAQGAELITVAPEPWDDGLHVPAPDRVPEPLAPLAHVVRAQQLAYHATLALGRDPDEPRGLAKVTLTR